MRIMRGERTSVRLAGMSGSDWRSTNDDAAQEKAANLIDHGSPLADKARPHPVWRLQIELLIALGRNKARRRSLHGLGHSERISVVILVPLPKRLRICWRNLSHSVAKRRRLMCNVVRCHLLQFSLYRLDGTREGCQSSFEVPVTRHAVFDATARRKSRLVWPILESKNRSLKTFSPTKTSKKISAVCDLNYKAFRG
jgi:hypothetical protein